MLIKTTVEHDTSGLEMVLSALDELSEERFIEGIIVRRYDEDDVRMMTEMVHTYQGRVNIESISLTRFSRTFIREFATNNNECYKTAEVFFGKIRSTVAGLKKVFHKTTPIDRRTLPEGADAPSVFEKSSLVNKEFTPDMYGLESYPRYVKEFYDALETLFASAANTLALCQFMIMEEEETRNDVVQLRQIFKESCEEFSSTVKMASMFQTAAQELPENKMDDLKQKTGANDDIFLKKAYHMYDKDTLCGYIMINTIRQARNNGLTPLESFFWPKNTHKALVVRKVIDNFDLVHGVEGQKGKLSPHVVLEFLKWCDVQECMEKRLFQELFLPKYQATGKLKALGWSRISDIRKERKECGDTDEKMASDFVARLVDILSPEELAA